MNLFHSNQNDCFLPVLASCVIISFILDGEVVVASLSDKSVTPLHMKM